MNLSGLHHKGYKEMTKLFHIKKTKEDTLFDSGSQANHIEVDLVNNLGLEVYDHPNPYSFEWEIKI